MKTILSLTIAAIMATSTFSAAATSTTDNDAGATTGGSMSANQKHMINDNPTVGGAAMMASDTIVVNASAAPNLTTLVAAVKAAGLVDTLKSAGPFTVFAPTNDAFAKLPKGAVEGLLKPEMKDALAGVLTYHVVAGNVDAAALMKKIKMGNGKAVLTTVQGDTLIATSNKNGIMLTDSSGGMAHVTTADVRQSNGVVHVIDSVLMPK